MSDDPIEDLRAEAEENQRDLETIINGEEHTEETPGEEETPTNEGETPETGSDEGSGGDTSEEESNENDNPEGKYTGVATAYKKPQKKSKGKGASHKDFAPPDRGKYKYADLKGDLIGDVLYNQLMKFFEWMLKSATDFVLDVLDYGLYKSFQGLAPMPKQKESKKTVFDYGREIEEGYNKNAAKGVIFYKQALQEVITNIEKKKNGEPVEWTVFREQPRWFDDAVQLEREATANPDSDAAKKWERFKNSDKIIEAKLENEAIYRCISTRIATFEEAMKGEEFKLPENISKKIQEMEKLLEKDKINPDDLKQKMAEKINEMRALTGGVGFVNNAINAKLDAMQTVVTGGENDIVKLKRSLKSPIEQIKEINPTPEHIKTLSREDYEKITKNLDKIREKYKNDPQRCVEVMSAYVNNIITALNNTQKDVIKYEEANRFSKSNFAEKTKEGLYGLINKAGEYITKDGKPLINLRTQKEKAENGIKAVKGAIDDFLVENIKISEYADATRRSSVPDASKSAMLRQMSAFIRQGRR